MPLCNGSGVRCRVSITPYTLSHTTLQFAQVDNIVNTEYDYSMHSQNGQARKELFASPIEGHLRDRRPVMVMTPSYSVNEAVGLTGGNGAPETRREIDRQFMLSAIKVLHSPYPIGSHVSLSAKLNSSGSWWCRRERKEG